MQLEIIRLLYSSYGEKLHVLSKSLNLGSLTPGKQIVPSQKYNLDDKIEINTIKYLKPKLLINTSGMFCLYRKIRKLKKELKAKQPNDKILFVVYNPFYRQTLPVYLAKSHKDEMLDIVAEGLDIRYLGKKRVLFYDSLAHLINKCLFKKNDWIATYCAETVKKYAPKLDYIELIHACDDKIFDGIKQEEYKQEGKITLLYAGTLTTCYGIDAILEAMKNLPENYNLLICGSGNSEIVSRVKEAENCDSRIHYMGLIAREEVIKLEVAADILLIIRVSESKVDEYINRYCQPSKLSEYLMSGTPVLATKITSIPDVIDTYLNYTNKNPIEIANCIQLIAENENNYYGNKAANGKAFAQNNFTYEKQHSKLLEFIHRIEFEK